MLEYVIGDFLQVFVGFDAKPCDFSILTKDIRL